MVNMLLAAGTLFGVDPQMILYLVILIASVVGGIIQQSKQEKGTKDKRPPSRTEPDAGTRPAPTPRETSGPISRPAPERAPVPARPPLPPRPRPQRASRATETRRPEVLARMEPPRHEPVFVAEIAEPHRAPLAATAAARSTGDAAAIRVQQSRARLLALLKERESLRTAFLLQEVFGPPAALRDERGVR